MQVNSVHQSPNFGMALKIKPEALDDLKSMSRSEIEKLQKVGEQLKDTVQYHLVVGKGGHRVIDSGFANKYAGGSVILQKPDSELLKFNATWEGTELKNLKKGSKYTSCIKFADKEAALKAYEDIKASGSNYVEQDAKIVKYLDDAFVKKTEIEKAEQAEIKAVSDMVDDLFAKYPAQ